MIRRKKKEEEEEEQSGGFPHTHHDTKASKWDSSKVTQRKSFHQHASSIQVFLSTVTNNILFQHNCENGCLEFQPVFCADYTHRSPKGPVFSVFLIIRIKWAASDWPCHNDLWRKCRMMAFKFCTYNPMCKHKRTYLQKVLALKKKQRNKKTKKKKKYLTIFSKLLKTELHGITIRNVYGWSCGNN